MTSPNATTCAWSTSGTRRPASCRRDELRA
jgi:hypothetical protein